MANMVSELTRPQRRFLHEFVTDMQSMFYQKRTQTELGQRYNAATSNSLIRRGLVTPCTDGHGRRAYALTGKGKMFLSAIRYFSFRKEERSSTN